MRLTIQNQFPSIELLGDKKLTFFIDSGAGASLIKLKALSPNITYNKSDILYLTGISRITVPTLGSLKITLLNHTAEFHVVPNDFPIIEDGLIGVKFLSEAKAKINWKENCLEVGKIKAPFIPKEKCYTIPARCKKVIDIKIEDTNLNEGFIEQIHVNDKIFMGNAMVRVNNGYIKILATNTDDKPVNFKLMPTKVYEVDQIKYCAESKKRICNRRKRRYANLLKIITHEQESKRFEQIWSSLQLDHLAHKQKKEIKFLVMNSTDCFHLPGEKLPSTEILQHKIPTVDETSITVKQYRFPPKLKDEITKQTDEMFKNGIIKHSDSSYKCPLWIVPKKTDKIGEKRWRLVLDFRKLNEKTTPDNFPIPNISEILEQLGNAQYFSTFDLASGFHQIKMHPEDSHKTAFSTLFSKYEFSRMPFGLRNAPATFQRLMNIVLSGLNGTEMFVYLDDVIIYAKTLEEHRQKYLKLIGRLRKANLKLEPKKCYFLRSEINYLGHLICKERLRPDPKKIEAVKLFPRLKTVKNIKEFLGLAGYYRRFIHNFSKISKPLTMLLQKDVKFKWDVEQNEAFDTLKQKLCEEPILTYPDFSKPFILTTNA